MYDANHVNYNRTVEWYQDQFKDWSGPSLYWWFRDMDTDVNNWYQVK